MACIENCVVTETFFIFRMTNVDFTFTDFVSEGEAISFQSVETSVDGKYTHDGQLFLAGHDYTKLKFTIMVPCNDVAKSLFGEFNKAPNRACGRGDVSTDCCTDISFGSLWLKSVTLPSIGDSVDYYEFEFEGVPV